MKPILAHAQGLVYTLMQLMPTPYQRQNLQAMLGLFLQAQGHPLPAYSQAKSPSALSRFLNESRWSTRAVIVTIRAYILSQLLGYRPLGCRPWLQVIVDLTTLEKRGKFKAFESLLSVLQGKQECIWLSSTWWLTNGEFLGAFEFTGVKALELQHSWLCA